MVARDSEGKLVGAGVQKINHSFPPLIAEAMSMRFGTQVAIQRGWTRVELETDCLQLLKHLKNRTFNRHSDGILFEDITWQSRYFREYKWLHIQREGNNLAHIIASEDPGPASNSRIGIDTFPEHFLTLAEQDCN